jgi:hypothetical protein
MSAALQSAGMFGTRTVPSGSPARLMAGTVGRVERAGLLVNGDPRGVARRQDRHLL